MRINQIMANCIVLEDEQTIKLVSYEKIIVSKSKIMDSIILDTNYWNFSRTTGKHRNWFLTETLAITTAKIKSGQYALDNLNK